MIEPYKKNILVALKKAHNHIPKIIKMIEEDKYCADIMQQILAVQGYLKSASSKSLESHLHTCGASLNSKKSEEKDRFIKELVRIFGVFNRG